MPNVILIYLQGGIEVMSILFSPTELGSIKLRNRIVLPPMCQYSADENGTANNYHFTHYGVRALSGAALCIVEATAVTADGRISGADLGLWSEQHIEPLSQLAQSIACFGSVPGIQLGHAGRKAWSGIESPVAPSAIPFSDQHRTPLALTADDVRGTTLDFAAAARRAVEAGFKVLELHAAHGYLIHEFLSPLSNRRTDAYGGSMENRHRFLLETADECLQVLSEDSVLIVRISATEYDEAGYSLEEMAALSRSLEAKGVAAIHVSTGGNVPLRPAVWPGYQLPYAKAIREAVGIPVIGVGLLGTPDLAEYALQQGACDMVAVGRAYLHDPHWAITAARAFCAELPIPEAMQKGLAR
jgi:NADPH2 dehydrogenase